MTYITTDDAIRNLPTLGKGALLAKVDIKHTFRLIPVHPVDCHMLVMEWKSGVYIDTCLLFSCRSTPKLFNIMADLLAWILEHQRVTSILHYLDDFLTIASPQSQACQRNLDIIIHVCQLLNIPLALEKVEGHTTCLGIITDTNYGGAAT